MVIKAEYVSLTTTYSSQSIHQIRQHLQKATSINADNQIILYGPPYIRLDPRKPLYAYALPSVKDMLLLLNLRNKQIFVRTKKKFIYTIDQI